VPTPTVEERLQTLEDRTALADLVHDYARLVDECEPEQVAALFTDDVRIDYGPALGGPQQGREAVDRFFQGLYSFERTSHHVSNHQISFLGADRARGVVYVLAWHQFREDRPPKVPKTSWVMGRYEDEYVRTKDGWRFAARRESNHGQEGFDIDWNQVPRKERPK
jgi:3-phenylpropionate/cinnamic acid dioxygenase small subunit